MNTLKKTIFLSNKNDGSVKTLAVLTLEKKSNGIFCTIKSYNTIPKGDLILGLKSSDKVIKQNISFNNNTYNFILSDKVDLDNSIGCVLFENKNTLRPLIWGSEKSDNYKHHIITNLNSQINKLSNNNLKNVTAPKDNTAKCEIENFIPNTQFDNLPLHEMQGSPHIQEEYTIESVYSPINSKLTNEYNCNLQNINYFKEETYSQISLEEESLKHEQDVAVAKKYSDLFESSDEEIEKNIDKEVININGKEHKFYQMIAEQLDELFDKYPREFNLENLIENSKWVKINFENDNKYYVVGIIYINDDIKYICYGVPGEYNNEPPRELQGYSQWLPTNTNAPYTDGYWVMYQDADTGENIYLN